MFSRSVFLAALASPLIHGLNINNQLVSGPSDVEKAFGSSVLLPMFLPPRADQPVTLQQQGKYVTVKKTSTTYKVVVERVSGAESTVKTTKVTTEETSEETSEDTSESVTPSQKAPTTAGPSFDQWLFTAESTIKHVTTGLCMAAGASGPVTLMECADPNVGKFNGNFELGTFVSTDSRFMLKVDGLQVVLQPMPAPKPVVEDITETTTTTTKTHTDETDQFGNKKVTDSLTEEKTTHFSTFARVKETPRPITGDITPLVPIAIECDGNFMVVDTVTKQLKITQTPTAFQKQSWQLTEKGYLRNVNVNQCVHKSNGVLSLTDCTKTEVTEWVKETNGFVIKDTKDCLSLDGPKPIVQEITKVTKKVVVYGMPKTVQKVVVQNVQTQQKVTNITNINHVIVILQKAQTPARKPAPANFEQAPKNQNQAPPQEPLGSTPAPEGKEPGRRKCKVKSPSAAGQSEGSTKQPY
jgi:Zn-finger protein